jgi:hypothetical protein
LKKPATPLSNKLSKKPAPEMKWQSGDYERYADFHFILPSQFLLLCRLMEIRPEQVLNDFMDNLSCGSWNREGREQVRAKLVEYFVAHGYGQDLYSAEDIRSIFKEMDAIGLVWPADADMKLIELSSKWRKKFHRYWFKKWLRKPRRRLV